MAVYENKGSLDAKYIVTRAPDRSGNYVCDGVADQVQINQAINDLTAGRTDKEVVQLKGEFVIDGTIFIDDHTWLRGPAQITKAFNGDMIMQMDWATDRNINWTISHLLFEGERGSFTGHAINCLQATSSDSDDRFKQIHDCIFDDIYGSGIYAVMTAPVIFGDCTRFYNLEFRYTGSPNIHFRRVFDYQIHNVRYNGGGANGSVFIEDCYHGFHEQEYYAGNPFVGLTINGGRDIRVSDAFMDFGVNTLVCAVDFGAWESRMSNINIRGLATIAAGLPGIYIRRGGHGHPVSSDNHFDNIFVIGDGANKWSWAIEETDGDHNTYSNINGRDCSSGALELLGANGNVDFHTIDGAIYAPDDFVNTDDWSLDRNHYVNATPSVNGLTINGAGEIGYYHGTLPSRISRVLRVKVAGVAHGGVGAGQMHIDMDVEGATHDEVWNATHSTALPALDSYAVGAPAANDIIYWYGTAGTINNISGDDAVYVKLEHSAAAEPDVATNASIYQVVLQCV